MSQRTRYEPHSTSPRNRAPRIRKKQTRLRRDSGARARCRVSVMSAFTLKERVDERRRAAAGQRDQQHEQQKYQDERNQPPLLRRQYEAEEFAEQRRPAS